jgi:hypothetical protein
MILFLTLTEEHWELNIRFAMRHPAVANESWQIGKNTSDLNFFKWRFKLCSECCALVRNTPYQTSDVYTKGINAIYLNSLLNMLSFLLFKNYAGSRS